MRPGDRIRSLQGPILVLGASGFVGANLARTLLEHRADVVATTSRTPAWRLEDLPARNVREFDALVALNVDRMLDEVQPRTVFNCIAYGAYSFETDGELILRTNLMSTHALLERLATRNIAAYIHAGSSSEYGENAAGPEEHDFLAVNSEYAVSKAACAHLIHYYGKQHGLPSANLRLYSVYGPLEDPSRLMPKIVQHGVRGELPPLVDPHIARDFVYSDDVVDAFVAAASELREDDYEISHVGMEGRGAWLDDALEQIKAIWQGGEVGPTTAGQPGLVIGGYVDASLERAVDKADGWIAGGMPPEAFGETAKKLEASWAEAGREGAPRKMALAYFALGDDPEGDANGYLTDYYAFLGEETAKFIADSAAKDAGTVRQYIGAFEAAGCDELILFPSSGDPAQVDLLADAVAG